MRKSTGETVSRRALDRKFANPLHWKRAKWRGGMKESWVSVLTASEPFDFQAVTHCQTSAVEYHTDIGRRCIKNLTQCVRGLVLQFSHEKHFRRACGQSLEAFI